MLIKKDPGFGFVFPFLRQSSSVCDLTVLVENSFGDGDAVAIRWLGGTWGGETAELRGVSQAHDRLLHPTVPIIRIQWHD